MNTTGPAPAAIIVPMAHRPAKPLRRLWELRLLPVLLPVRCYQRFISPRLPAACRYTPSCSQYMIEAVIAYGVVKGVWAGTWRVIRCNPFARGGADPVQHFAWWWEAEKRRQARRARAAMPDVHTLAAARMAGLDSRSLLPDAVAAPKPGDGATDAGSTDAEASEPAGGVSDKGERGVGDAETGDARASGE